ncbi:MAG: Proteasome lid subunit RPN8/RPN11, contains Jab1/MPN metalloenzyme (JAMM) motif [Chloroflexi bacterium]|nr:MAG: Proteasome lid subunit RPN8/RPN11, contains Jab1/MPN metalloenzyme (JAMM) motif [Chloroflexota bacterium]
MNIKKKFLDEIIKQALDEDPNECCGIMGISGDNVEKLYQMTNVEASPFRYRMDPKELYETVNDIEDIGLEVGVIYHSHTHSPAYPSETDVRIATWEDGTSVWPDTLYVLVSLINHENPDVRAFSLTDGVVQEENLNVS